MATLGERLTFARNRSGLTQSELARRAGATPQTVQAIEDPKRDIRNSRYIVRLAEALGVSTQWLAHEEGQPPPGWEGAKARDRATIATTERLKEQSILPNGSGAGDVPYRIEAKLLGWTEGSPPPGKVPLLTAARGGRDQEMFVEDGPIDFIPIPPELAGVPKAYAMLVIGESMEPMFLQGTIIYVNPNLAPKVRQGVVVWKKNRSILVKQLVRRLANRIVVREYTPRRRDFEILEAEIAELHAITGTKMDDRV